MDIVRTTHDSQVRPGLYESVVIADAKADSGAYRVVVGLDRSMVDTLKRFSLDESDEELQTYTSDRKRFGEGSYEAWFAKGRVPYALIHTETGALAALCWFGPKPLGQKSARYVSQIEGSEVQSPEAGEWHTISYRCYGEFRGKRLMRDFVTFCITEYQKLFPTARIWAIINDENPASVRLAEKLGFVAAPHASHPEDHLLVLIRQ